jgi:hypothetical protein
MALLTSIGGIIAGTLVDKIIGPVTGIVTSYLNKKISEEEMRAKMVEQVLEAIQTIEVTHAQELTKTYSAFMTAATQSRLIRWTWATVTLSQLIVLLWHQLGIPALVYFTQVPYPSSGSTVEWAYALLGGLVGLGVTMLRKGPAEIDVTKFQALIKK